MASADCDPVKVEKSSQKTMLFKAHKAENETCEINPPVEVFLHHFGDSPGHRSLLGGEVQVEVDPELLLQEVHDELGAGDLLVVVLDPGHLPLR